jgi:alpha(1,3/1,4) fucosyltransferase
MKKKIKIDFSDFWGGFDKTDNYFYNLLKEEFDVEISSNPDYLFFSLFGNQHQNYKCVKIFYTGENIAPPLGYCQYSFSFDYLDDTRNYRLPHYLLYDGYYELVRPKVIEESMSTRKFCNFVASNGDCQERNKFVQQLSKYKNVDCGGRWMNNIGGPVSDKRKFQSEYKFSIAFENNAYRPQHPGYTTEKIMEPMTVNSIPIYWGNPNINLEFNTKSFINFYDFNSEKDMIDYIIDLDKDDSKYLEILKQPWFINYNIPETNKIENIKSFLYKIFN